MSVTTSFEEKLVTECGTLSTRLKAAAGYFSARPADDRGFNNPRQDCKNQRDEPSKG